MTRYIHEHPEYPHFTWQNITETNALTDLSLLQGKLLGKMQQFGFVDQNTVMLNALTEEITKSSEIEGELLDSEKVRSSLARRLNIKLDNPAPESHHIDGIVQTLMDAVANYDKPLTKERLCAWHAALFPTGYSGMHKIKVGDYRDSEMQVVSVKSYEDKVHYEAPTPDKIHEQMDVFLSWINADTNENSIIRAAVAHLWFVIIHPFDDGNGRIARTITEMLLARAEKSHLRFYSMSAQIQKEKREYYKILEMTTTGDIDITGWIKWFCACLTNTISASIQITRDILFKSEFWQKYAEQITNTHQRQIMNLLLDGFVGNMTSGKVAKILKVSQDTATRMLQELTQQGFLEKRGAGRSTHYVKTEK